MSLTEESPIRAEQGPPPGGQPRPTGGRPGGGRWILMAVLVVIALVVSTIALVVALTRDDGEVTPATSTVPATSTSIAPTTTLAPVTTTAPTTVPPVTDTATAVWPAASSSIRFDDPVAAARQFAVDFLGFTDPVVGEFMQGDSRSGEVEVRPAAQGPATTVLVRQLGAGDTWWVLGAATANIVLEQPSALDEISSPVALRGTSTAFEATVQAEVRQDGQRQPLGEGYVMGGSMGEMGPFAGTLDFRPPTASSGAVVLYTVSMENGQVWEATVVRVHFGAAPDGQQASICPDYVATRPTPAVDQMVATVFFTCAANTEVAPSAVYRLVPKSAGVLRAALNQLLAGPTAPERAAGLRSWFSDQTAGMLADVRIGSAGAAVVDFHDLRTVIPNASSSFGSYLLTSQLDATVFQFDSVRSVIYRIDGDCEAFNEWLQSGGCEPRTRSS